MPILWVQNLMFDPYPFTNPWCESPHRPEAPKKGRVVAENRQISEGGFAFVYLVSWLDRMREMGDFRAVKTSQLKKPPTK
jgi:hypothetical protein